jgi:hypothetical protein
MKPFEAPTTLVTHYFGFLQNIQRIRGMIGEVRAVSAQ